MKRTLILLSILVSHSAISQTLFPGGVAGNVAWWNFASLTPAVTSFNDVSGNNNNGTPFNLVSTSNFRGISNKAMQFNGSGSYAIVPNSTTLQPQSISMVSVVKMDAYYTGSCQNSQILSKGSSSFSSGQFGLGVNDATYDNNNCATYFPNNMQLAVTYPSVNYTIGAGNYVSLNRWYFFAISHNADTARFYQVEMDSSNYVSNLTPFFTAYNFGSPIGTSFEPLQIGRLDNTLYPYWFNGQMDELVLFNKILNPNEMQDVYDFLWGKIVLESVDPVICHGLPFVLNYKVGDHIPVGNVFSAQLSDMNGSFANPTIIGTSTSNTSGFTGLLLNA
ncbi:MAG: hypothetical protein EOO89_31630, partial [Pedobacter sp.]